MDQRPSAPVSAPDEPEAPFEIEAKETPLTMADVLLALPGTALSPRQKTDMASAVRSLCKVLNRPPAGLSTDVSALAKLIAEASPLSTGMTKGRWARIRSLALTALRTCGVNVLPGRSADQLSEAWALAVSTLESTRQRYGLSRLARYMSQRGVTPQEVGEAHFAAFRDDLLTKSLLPNPEATYRLAVRIWNEAAEGVPDWPDQIIALEADPRRHSLPWESFAPGLRADVEMFLNRSRNPNPLSDDYSKPVAPKTIEERRKQIRQLASALVSSGFPSEKLTNLSVLVTKPNAEAALSYLYDRLGQTKTKHLASMARLLQTIARHWVKSREDDAWLTRVASNLTVPTAGMVEKNRRRLAQFDLPENVTALLKLPSRVLREAERRASGEREEALRVMHAVAVEILTMAPMRLENLTALELGKHLIEIRRGGARMTKIVIPSEETKTKAPFEVALPAESQALIDRYIADYRPLISDQSGPFLFPGPRGACRSPIAFSGAIPKFIRRETGLVMNVHLFRHLAGKLYLEANPSDIETVRRILSHRTSTTTLRSYTELASGQAIKRYDDLIARLRKADEPMAILGRGCVK